LWGARHQAHVGTNSPTRDGGVFDVFSDVLERLGDLARDLADLLDDVFR
jgi:hypothetical protein